ncbi:hypothetical protein M407DRAFT_5145 [Tulasnella calospora MUT 4182]|uniref:Uncharacterized protein n=1 Tax=Tulasnella calospora MUT 4182 TaxID=1051891 RepID=A0A0C3QHL5_9AGAM|nr:hypothetical protein M407DRAFT_5145 [Tulasnella calospora MUT 4182]
MTGSGALETAPADVPGSAGIGSAARATGLGLAGVVGAGEARRLNTRKARVQQEGGPVLLHSIRRPNNRRAEAALPLIHEDVAAASPISRTPADIRAPVTFARELEDRISAMTAQFNESMGAVTRTRLQSNPSTPAEEVRIGGRSAFVSAVSRSGNASPRSPVTRLASRDVPNKGIVGRVAELVWVRELISLTNGH